MPMDLAPQWWLIEWLDDKLEPANYFLSFGSPRTNDQETAHPYRDAEAAHRARLWELKGEQDFEGRRFPGWHHRISVALCCYAFIMLNAGGPHGAQPFPN